MDGTTEIPQKGIGFPRIGGCGSCTYNYSQQDGCYYRQGTGGCTGACSCSPVICGLGALLIKLLQPDTVTAGASFSLACLVAANDDDWLSKALHEHVAGDSSPAVFWKRVSIGLGVLSALLVFGLVVAIVY
jgi:F0F1-type ATP synthase membrane subunit c/vacuolar-type H+-ATPase subunit K